MKKTYFAPATEIITIATVGMIAASKDAVIDGEQGNEEALSREATPRRRSLWDDDEE